MTGGRRVCKECLAKSAAKAAIARTQAAVAEAKAQEAAAQARIDAARAQLDQAVAVLGSLGDVRDEADRLLVLMLLSDQLRKHFASFHRTVTNVLYEDLRTALVSAARLAIAPKSPLGNVSSDFPAGWTCDPTAIVDHYKRNGRLRSDTLTTVRLTYGKKRKVHGWNVGPAKGSSSPDVYVLTDWTILGAPGQNTLGLSHIHLLIKAGHITAPALPSSVPLGNLPGVTIPWISG